MIRTLLKLRLLSLFGGRDGRTGKRRNMKMRVLFGFLYLLLGGVFAYMFFGTFAIIGMVVSEMGEGTHWVFFAFAALCASLLQVMGSIFTTVTQLYTSKDNEMLLSLPIRPLDILLSRIAYLWLVDLLFGLLVLVPAGIVCAGVFGFTLGFWLLPLLAVALPFFSLSVSCLVGFLVSLIVKKIRRKNLVTTLLYLSLMGIYFAVYGLFLSGVEEEADFFALLSPLVEKFRHAYPFSWAGMGMSGGGVGWFFLFVAIALLLFALCLWLLSRNFLRIALGSGGVGRIRYREKSVQMRSPFFALVRREIYRFFHIPIYFMNCGLGLIMLCVGCVALPFVRPNLSAFFGGNAMPAEGMEAVLPVLLSLAATFILSVGNAAAPALSLEGKSLWILRSLPLEPKKVVSAQMVMQLVLAAPVALLAGVVISVVTLPGFFTGVCLCLALLAVVFFQGSMGAFVGAMLPKLEWTSETVPVKQGMAVLVAMLGGFGGLFLFAAILLGGITLYPVPALWFAASAFVFAGLGLLFYRLLVTKGAKKFSSLV